MCRSCTALHSVSAKNLAFIGLSLAITTIAYIACFLVRTCRDFCVAAGAMSSEQPLQDSDDAIGRHFVSAYRTCRPMYTLANACIS